MNTSLNKELSFEWRVLGGSASDAMTSIKNIDQLQDLEALLAHEQAHMNRKSVIKALEGRIRRLKKVKEALA